MVALHIAPSNTDMFQGFAVAPHARYRQGYKLRHAETSGRTKHKEQPVAVFVESGKGNKHLFEFGI